MMRLVESGRAGSRRAGSQEGDVLSRVMKEWRCVGVATRGGERWRGTRLQEVLERSCLRQKSLGRPGAAQQGEKQKRMRKACLLARALTSSKADVATAGTT